MLTFFISLILLDKVDKRTMFWALLEQAIVVGQARKVSVLQ
jgi:hypothetical protein